jgi:hypothetical protein
MVEEGDANTRFFHIHANVRRRWKFIHSLENGGRTLTNEASKEEAMFSFFDDILEVVQQRMHSINPSLLDLSRRKLPELSARFMEQELWQVIQSLLPDKALGPDGFTTRYL